MKKKLIVAAVAATTFGLAAAGTASADADYKVLSGGKCVQAGIGTLRTLGLFDEAVKKQIDYSTLADPVNGPIYTSLPAGSNLSLGKVVSLHATNPALFDWCRIAES